MFLLVTAASAADPALTISPARPAYTLGEPLWVDLVVTNTGQTPLEFGLVDAPLLEEWGLEIEATDAAGRPALDPRHEPRRGFLSFAASRVVLAPSESFSVRVDVARFAWLPPGEWQVRARWEVTDEPTDWASTRLIVAPVTDPTRARAIVDALPTSWDAQSTSDRAAPRTRWESLGHPVYVPILEPLARATPEERAFRGLASCPCVEATEALLRLFDAVPEPRRWEVGEELLRRASPPGPSTAVSPPFLERSWGEHLRGPLLERGRVALRSASASGGGVAFGVEVVRRYGDASDVPLLVGALERALAHPPPGVMPAHVAVAEVLWALERWPAEVAKAPTRDPRAQLLLDLVPWDGRTGAPPAGIGWDQRVERALASRDVLVAKLACERAPPVLTAGIVQAALPLIGTLDPLLAHRLGRLFHRADPVARDGLLAALPTASGPRTVALLGFLKQQVPADVWVGLVLEHGKDSPEAVAPLTSLLDCREGGRSPLADADLPGVVAAWSRVLSLQRDVLARDGKLPILPGQTDPALVWPGWICHLPTGDWPKPAGQ